MDHGTDVDALDDIPRFLRRNPDNTLPDVRPSEAELQAGKRNPVSVTAAVIPAPATDARERQAELRAAQDEHRREKTEGRIKKMKAIKADREARSAGKTWDPQKARWV